MGNYANLPVPTPEGGLNRYMQEIRKFPLLEPEEEYMLAKRWAEDQDTEAAHKMVTSHLRLAAKIAMGYRGYGLPQSEVISEANVGLMQAVKRFDPEKGFRLSTYAMWWIRASIQEYILRSWSLVKLGTTSAQKKLFFNLRKAKARIGALEEGDMRPDSVRQIAHDLGVTEEEVISMNQRMSGSDASLNATVGAEGEGSMQWQDWLEDEHADQAGAYEAQDELAVRRELLAEAMDVLNERERDILTQRRLNEESVTLRASFGSPCQESRDGTSMTDEAPKIVQKAPMAVKVEAGKSYSWCACGRSANQPFCDGSHKGTGFAPVKYTPETDGKAVFCACKHSGNAPLCDGSHASL